MNKEIYNRIFQDNMQDVQFIPGLSWQKKAMMTGANTYAALRDSALKNGDLEEAVKWNDKFQRVDNSRTVQEAYGAIVDSLGKSLRLLGVKI